MAVLSMPFPLCSLSIHKRYSTSFGSKDWSGSRQRVLLSHHRLNLFTADRIGSSALPVRFLYRSVQRRKNWEHCLAKALNVEPIQSVKLNSHLWKVRSTLRVVTWQLRRQRVRWNTLMQSPSQSANASSESRILL